jgi:hypothetical protein
MMWARLLLLIAVVVFPMTSWAQGVPAFAQRQDLLSFYSKFFIQNLGRLQTLDVFRDGTVLHGTLRIHGISTSTTTDPVTVAQNVANSVRAFFAIPNDYQFVVLQGGFDERLPIQPIGNWRQVGFVLQIDGVRLEGAFVAVMFDAEGKTRSIDIGIPRLRPEIVAAVRGPTITPFEAAVAIRLDANSLPPKNKFMITPNTGLKYVDFMKVALPEPPYIIYQSVVNSALYRVNAKTGAILGKLPLTME